MKKTALFGGSFDPIHIGHTTVIAAAAEQIGAEKTIFIPAKHSPLKDISPYASDLDRLKMISLAIAGNEKFDLSDYELTKSSPSYTLDTVSYFQQQLGSDTLIYWLAGADTIKELDCWYGAEELIDECRLCLMYRAGCDRPDFSGFKKLWGKARVEKLQQNIIETPLIDISSTQIRNALAAGGDVTEMLAPAVADYISKNHLYR